MKKKLEMKDLVLKMEDRLNITKFCEEYGTIGCPRIRRIAELLINCIEIEGLNEK